MRNPLPALALPVALAACGADGLAAGQIDVTLQGKDFPVDGAPAPIFVDDWAVAYDAFEVTVGGISAVAGHHGPELTDPDYSVHDLTADAGGGLLVTSFEAPGGVYDHVGYVIDGVTVAGTATRDVETITFAWEFPGRVLHSHCDTMVTVDGTIERIDLTIHGDHLFFTHAGPDDSALAFQAIADADGADGTTPDGAITAAELSAVDLAALDGYDADGLPLADLWQFVAHQVTTIGHVDGEHHCDVEVLD